MRIFLTGATGYVGRGVLDALVRAGHTVTALVRDGEKAKRVAAKGGRPVIGNLAEPESYRAAADAQDGYVHTAFDTASGRGPAIDRIALDTMIVAARRPRTAGATTPRARFLIYTSGIWVLGRSSDPVAEDAPLNPLPIVAWRPAHEDLVTAAGSGRVRAWRGGDIRAVYYTVLATLVVWGIVAMRLAQPIVLLKIGANVAGAIFIIAAPHLLYINTRLLPPHLRPPMWRRVALVVMTAFYGVFVGLSFGSLW
jgi:uncharacterized protein YbjT (DUF2867 family)